MSEEDSIPVQHLVLVLANLAALVILGIMLLVVVPKAAMVFEDFGEELPRMGTLVMRFADPPALPAGLMFLLVLFEGLLYGLAKKGRVLLLMAFALLTIILALVVGLSVVLPMLRVFAEVSSG